MEKKISNLVPRHPYSCQRLFQIYGMYHQSTVMCVSGMCGKSSDFFEYPTMSNSQSTLFSKLHIGDRWIYIGYFCSYLMKEPAYNYKDDFPMETIRHKDTNRFFWMFILWNIKLCITWKILQQKCFHVLHVNLFDKLFQ